MGSKDLLPVLDRQAEAFAAMSRYGDAEATLRRGLGLRESALGPTHPDVGHNLQRLAEVLHATRRDADELQALERWLKVAEARTTPPTPRRPPTPCAKSPGSTARPAGRTGPEPLILRSDDL